MFLNPRKLYYSLSPSLRLLIRRIVYLPSDLIHKSKYKNELRPPEGMIFTGSGDFIQQGETFLQFFVDFGGLKPDHSVLDIGSGIGRMAIPLTKYLSDKGKYEGFDIVKMGTHWCTKNITSKFPNFSFTHIDLKNSLYNLGTDKDASKFRFPYKDNYFDFVILTSVFTHMMPADVENYLNEIDRVLKDSGACLATFFILNKESKEHLNKHTDFKFEFNKGNYSLMDEKVPEANVAINYEFLAGMINKAGLKIKSEYFGFWSGRSKSESLSFQDILVLGKLF